MQAAELFLDAFDRRREVFHAKLKQCRSEFSEAAVHDLRVAARRLLAFVEAARLLESSRKPLKVRDQLKDLIGSFNKLRDAQVMLANLDAHMDEEPSLKPLRQHLLGRELRLLREARQAADDFEAAALKRRLASLRRRLAERLAQPDLDVDPFAAVDEAFAVVVSRDQAAKADQPETIHRVRLAFKKFRYRLEIVQAAVPGLPKNHLKHLDTYQTIVGRIQDAETFLALLDRYAKRHPDYQAEAARAYYVHLRAMAIDAWLADRGALAAFWRASPEAAFPWLRRRSRRKADGP